MGAALGYSSIRRTLPTQNCKLKLAWQGLLCESRGAPRQHPPEVTPSQAVRAEPRADPTNVPLLSSDMRVANSVASTPWQDGREGKLNLRSEMQQRAGQTREASFVRRTEGPCPTQGTHKEHNRCQER